MKGVPLSAQQLVRDYLKKALPGYAPDGRLRPGVVRFDPDDWLPRRENIEEWLRAKERIYDNVTLRSRAYVSDETGLTHEAECEALEMIEAFCGVTTKERKIRPLEKAASMIADDLILLRQEADEPARMSAAAVVFSFGQLPNKVGQTLAHIHTPVPGYNRWLRKPLDTFFQRLEPNKPFRRSNFELRWSPDLVHPSLMTGQLEAKGQLGRPPLGKPLENTFNTAAMIHSIHLRAEIQTLRRLPRSNYILFTVDSLTDPIDSILEHPLASAALHSRLESLGSDLAEYKGLTPDIRSELTAALHKAAASLQAG